MAPTTKENNSVNEAYSYDYKKDIRTALPQFIAVSVKNLLLIVYGMSLGFSTILIPAVKEPAEFEILHLKKSEISWITYMKTLLNKAIWSKSHAGSINLIVVPVGCALSGILTAPLGRRRSMQMVTLPFFVAWLIFYFSTSTSHLYGALFLTGLAGGLLEAPVLTYVAEVTQPYLRGMLSATSSMSIILGVFTQFLFGLLFYWRIVALVNIIFTVLALIALCFIPESPHWLVSKKRDDDAKKSLQWLRGWTSEQAVEDELREIQVLYKRKKVENEHQEETLLEKMSAFLDRSFLVPYFLVSYSFFVGHFSGMTTLQTYAVSIFQTLEAPIDKYYATLILGILQLLGASICVLLVHYTGKRPLTFFSTATAGICCLLVAGYDGYNKTHFVNNATLNSSNISNTTIGAADNALNNPYSWIPMTLLMMLALLTHTGIRLLPWILVGEVFSAKTRAGGAGLASAIGYIFGFLTNKIYISMVDQLSIRGTYSFYGFICLSGCVVFYFILPETEGKNLQDIQNHFAGVKSLTNEVYRSKKKRNVDVSRMQDLKGTSNPTFEEDNII